MPTPSLLTAAAYQAAETAFAEFCQTFPSSSVEANEVIIEAGRSPELLYYITDGSVKMVSTSSLGDTVTLHVFYPGSCFSFLTYVQPNNTYDFISMTKTTLHKIPFAKMTNYLADHPEATLVMNAKLLKGLQGLLHRIEQSVFVSAYYQVAGIIYYFAHHFATNEPSLITLKVTHKDISEWLGLSRENVSLQMKQLERDGVISRRGQLIQIENSDELRRLATPQDLLL